jgi:Tfp pilus assembly protein PilN
MSFSIPRPVGAEARRLWMRRTGILARFGYHVSAGAAIGVVLLVLSAVGLRWTVETKVHAWSGELKRWDEFQKRKASVVAQLDGMTGLLSRRTEGYADLQRISSLLPSDLWLQSWEMDGRGGTGFTHRISGYSPIEARVPEFLANLEKTRKFASVKLKSTERIKGEAVEQKTGIQANRKDLIHFEMGVVR